MSSLYSYCNSNALLPPLAHTIKTNHPTRWLRIHSLPNAKRYPTTAAERTELLHRQNTVISDLATSPDLWLVTTTSSATAAPPIPPSPDHLAPPTYWSSAKCDEQDPDSAYLHFFTRPIHWQPTLLDPLLLNIADNKILNLLLISPAQNLTIAPYDGGTDLLLPSQKVRDALKQKYLPWTSSRNDGR